MRFVVFIDLFSVCVISIVVSPDSVVRWLVVIFGGVDLIPVVGVVVCVDSVAPWVVVFLVVDLVVVVSIGVVFCIVVGFVVLIAVVGVVVCLDSVGPWVDIVVLSIACGIDPDHVVEVPGVDRDVGSAIKDPQYSNILNQC